MPMELLRDGELFMKLQLQYFLLFNLVKELQKNICYMTISRHINLQLKSRNLLIDGDMKNMMTPTSKNYILLRRVRK